MSSVYQAAYFLISNFSTFGNYVLYIFQMPAYFGHFWNENCKNFAILHNVFVLLLNCVLNDMWYNFFSYLKWKQKILATESCKNHSYRRLRNYWSQEAWYGFGNTKMFLRNFTNDLISRLLNILKLKINPGLSL